MPSLNRKPLLTSEQIVERSGEPYAVTCDRCHGKMFVDGILCTKCSGDGRILITPKVSTFSQRVAVQMFWLMFGAATVVLMAIALLRWFRLI